MKSHRVLKSALPFALAAIAFLLTGFLLLSIALAAGLAVAFEGSSLNWCFGFLIVGFAWLIFGGIAVYGAKQQLTPKGIVPGRIIQILNGDKAWLQQEAKNIL